MGLIIQTIRRDPSESDQIDDPSNVSRPDPSGADQTERRAPGYGSGAWGVDDCRSGSRRGKVAEYLVDGVVAELLADARCTTISGLGMSHPICYE